MYICNVHIYIEIQSDTVFSKINVYKLLKLLYNNIFTLNLYKLIQFDTIDTV